MIIWLPIVVLILVILFMNYWHGKHFHGCTKCEPNKIYITPVPSLPTDCLEILENEIRTKGTRLNPELNFSNAQGRKLNYNQLPECVQKFYDVDELSNIVSEVVGEKVYLAPMSEQYRIFARLYEDDDDFLEWHYDNNFTKGTRYTIVIPVLVDEGSTSEFEIKDRKTRKEEIIKVPLGSGVIYNGSDVYHRITRQTKGMRRMVVIIPLYSDYEIGPIGKIRQKFRNIIYKKLTL